MMGPSPISPSRSFCTRFGLTCSGSTVASEVLLGAASFASAGSAAGFLAGFAAGSLALRLAPPIVLARRGRSAEVQLKPSARLERCQLKCGAAARLQ